MDNSVLISLGDSRMKAVAEVLGNKSCVRILDLLGGEDLTVTDIASRLKMQLNTADYNVKKLVEAGLVEKASHWWSVKGRKMIVYRISNRKIVISPKRKVAGKFLWILGLTGAIAVWLRSLNVGEVAGTLVDDGRVVMRDAVFDAAPKAEALAVNAGGAGSIQAIGLDSVGFWAGLAGWEWFLIGAWSAIVLFFIYSLVAERRIR